MDPCFCYFSVIETGCIYVSVISVFPYCVLYVCMYIILLRKPIITSSSPERCNRAKGCQAQKSERLSLPHVNWSHSANLSVTCTYTLFRLPPQNKLGGLSSFLFFFLSFLSSLSFFPTFMSCMYNTYICRYVAGSKGGMGFLMMYVRMYVLRKLHMVQVT